MLGGCLAGISEPSTVSSLHVADAPTARFSRHSGAWDSFAFTAARFRPESSTNQRNWCKHHLLLIQKRGVRTSEDKYLYI